MSADSDQLSPVELLAEEFLERQQRGEKPTIGEYCARHPELADEIRDVFEAVAMVEELKPDSQDATGTFGNGSPGQTRPLKHVGDYRILRVLGRGGMGVVYEAEQESLSRRVALKVLPRTAAGDRNALRRFQREARAAARMHHTNIVPVFEVGEDNEIVFYAMQLIHGQGLDLVVDDLRQLKSERGSAESQDAALRVPGASQPAQSLAASLVAGEFEQRSVAVTDSDPVSVSDDSPELRETVIASGGSTASAVLPGQSELSTAEANRRGYFLSVAQIGLQTASALSYAHARGIIHRDIKPSNLLLDSTGVVWVTDFGLAKTSDSAMTHTGDILGTLRYMSPERFKGQCDVRADVYSLGLTLYELLVLKPAFESPDRVKLIDMVTRSEPVAPRSIDPRIPRDLETIVLKASDKDPRRRYQSADDLAEDLRRFVADEPIQARRVSLLERFSRWGRRNRPLAASLTALAVSLMLFAFWSQYKWGEEREMNLAMNALATENLDKAKRARDAERAAVQAQKQLTEQLDNARALRAVLNTRLAAQLLDNERGAASAVEELLTSGVVSDSKRRDFPWRYVWTRLRRSGSFSVFVEGSDQAGITPDGRLLTLDARMNLSEWRNDGRSPLRTHQLRSWGPLRTSRFSPDGTAIVVVNTAGAVQLFDATSGMPTHKLNVSNAVTHVTYSPNGEFVATMGRAKGNPHHQIAEVWEVENGRLHCTIQIKPPEDGWAPAPVRAFALAPDGNTVLVAGFPNHAAIHPFHADAGKNKVFELQHASTVFGVTWSPDGSRLASGDSNGKVTLWDTENWRPVGTLDAHSTRTTELRFSPDSKQLATGSKGGLIKVWDARAQELLRQLKGHVSLVTSLAFSSDGLRLASGTNGGHAKVWELKSIDETSVLAARRAEVGVISIAREHTEIDGTRAVGLRIGRVDAEHDNVKSGKLKVGDVIVAIEVDGVLRSPDEISGPHLYELLFSGETGDVVRAKIQRSDATESTESHEVSLVRETKLNGRWRVAISPNGRWMAATGDGAWYLWDLRSRTQIRQMRGTGYGVAFSPDSSTLAVNVGYSVRIWNLGTLQATSSWVTGGWVSSLAFSPSGERLAAGIGFPGHTDGPRIRTPVRIWDVNQQAEIAWWHAHHANVNSVAFSPDGTKLATASQDMTVKLWNVKDWTQHGQDFEGSSDMKSVAYSPDGTLVAGDHAGQIHIWNTRTGERSDLLMGHGNAVHALAFSPGGRTLASASWDRTVKPDL